jgi:hypothetical protein
LYSGQQRSKLVGYAYSSAGYTTLHYTTFYEGPNFFASGLIFWLIWPKVFARSWQHCTLVWPLRSGAKKAWLLDDNHYLYRRNGENKAGIVLINILFKLAFQIFHFVLGHKIYYICSELHEKGCNAGAAYE